MEQTSNCVGMEMARSLTEPTLYSISRVSGCPQHIANEIPPACLDWTVGNEMAGGPITNRMGNSTIDIACFT